ncbi:hypothetical protein XA68_12494 [Ophiocordyceps unilateralis]|uniref:Uncharacterized protein n=1 Tax=Ophiocordyceps unilateralis TaxID=268505 RepID=A0A2A9PEK5_OPHUN|nr:hypothetical protein XA68_12494 [Ophiocordyceps unilateralis]
MTDQNCPPGNPSPTIVFGALGAILGYIGAESGTTACFERQLWPQRSYSSFNLSSALGVALFTPMGGPLFKMACHTLDGIFQNGLFFGSHEGHMLGTVFFPQRHWIYTIFRSGKDGRLDAASEPARNCLWAQALSHMPMPPISSLFPPQPSKHIEGGQQEKPKIRAEVAVHHLRVSLATPEDKSSSLPLVAEDSTTLKLPTLLAIVTSELTSLLTAIYVLAYFGSSWAFLWMAPLVIRLISAAFALYRDPLIDPRLRSDADNAEACFKVHTDQPNGHFMLFTGPRLLVQQFFEHYGHPRRHRVREMVQVTTLIFFYVSFPLQLLASLVWMPLQVQYVWLCYQMYAVVATHITRYSRVGLVDTAHGIAKAFTEPEHQQDSPYSHRACTILFGSDRQSPSTLVVSLAVTYHSRYMEGKKAMESLLKDFSTLSAQEAESSRVERQDTEVCKSTS